MSGIRLVTDVVVIGAGQAGLSAAHHLQRLGLEPVKQLIVLDDQPEAGGAWRHRWPSLTLSTVNRLHDLPGLPFADVVGSPGGEVQANRAVPEYFAAYERHFKLPVWRPVKVARVGRTGGGFLIRTDSGKIRTRGIINATGTWQTPNVPIYPGSDAFLGRQLHTVDYRMADEFAGQKVVIVGGGISALQLLDEVSRVADTTWVTRREPDFREGPFDETAGRRAVAIVEDRVRRGLPPESVVSITGLPVTEHVRAMRERGVLQRKPMFSELLPDGIRWPDGSSQVADVIIWNTGFRSSLDHLAPLGLKNEAGGITMDGRLATRVAAEPAIHLVGYGPSASTIGANRAGGVAARELLAELELLPAQRPVELSL